MTSCKYDWKAYDFQPRAQIRVHFVNLSTPSQIKWSLKNIYEMPTNHNYFGGGSIQLYKNSLECNVVHVSELFRKDEKTTSTFVRVFTIICVLCHQCWVSGSMYFLVFELLRYRQMYRVVRYLVRYFLKKPYEVTT